MSNDYTLFDYSVNLNDCIQLWGMKPVPVKDKNDLDDTNIVEKLVSGSDQNVQVEAVKPQR